MTARPADPRPLREGDSVGVVAISGPVHRERLDRGIRWIERAGHPVIRGRSLGARHGFLAGRDVLRAADLDRAIHAPDLPALFFARGGWGAARILDRIDLAALRRRPRVLLGFSDLTTLFMALQKGAGPFAYRYGPTVSQLGEAGAYHQASLRDALYLPSGRLLHPLGRRGVIRPGRASGRLIGGCLTQLVGLLGTRYDVSWDGCILFWEEVNEEPYAIDRMLTQLRLAGKLSRLAGMIVGRLAGCEPRGSTPGLPLREIVLDAVSGTRYPVCTGFPAGHVRGKRTLLMGVAAAMDTARGRLETAARRS